MSADGAGVTGIGEAPSGAAAAGAVLATLRDGLERAAGAGRGRDVARVGAGGLLALAAAGVAAAGVVAAGVSTGAAIAGPAAGGWAGSTTTGAGAAAAAGGSAGLTSCASNGVEHNASDAAIAWNAQDERLIRLVMPDQRSSLSKDATVMRKIDEVV